MILGIIQIGAELIRPFYLTYWGINRVGGKMKLKGKKLEGPQERVVVLPRQQGENLIFKFAAVLEMDNFDKLCPIPEPKEILKPGGNRVLDIESKEYREALDDWAMKKTHYMYLKSIEATDDLEWETVDMNDPDTWENYGEELLEAGLTEAERLKLLQVYSEVQGLDQSKIDAATKSFLATPQEAQESS